MLSASCHYLILLFTTQLAFSATLLHVSLSSPLDLCKAILELINIIYSRELFHCFSVSIGMHAALIYCRFHIQRDADIYREIYADVLVVQLSHATTPIYQEDRHRESRDVKAATHLEFMTRQKLSIKNIIYYLYLISRFQKAVRIYATEYNLMIFTDIYLHIIWYFFLSFWWAISLGLWKQMRDYILQHYSAQEHW